MVFTGIIAILCSSFYIHTPERLLGRVNSFGAGMSSVVIALAHQRHFSENRFTSLRCYNGTRCPGCLPFPFYEACG